MNEAHVRLVGDVHRKLVLQRRVAVLANSVSEMLPESSTLLDVGCGDGTVAKILMGLVPGLKVTGVEYSPRSNCVIPCSGFDGKHLPFANGSFDGCMFIDVLHHSLEPLAILRDAARVCRRFIVIKDHLAENTVDHWTLRLMDWVGNRPHGVVLPYAYLSRQEWVGLYRDAGLVESDTNREIPIYPAPFSLIFGRGLHFVSVLTKK